MSGRGIVVGLKPDLPLELGRLDADMIDLTPKLKRDDVSDIRWRFRPGLKVEATGNVKIAGHLGALVLDVGLSASPDGRLGIAAERARLSWRGLSADVRPLDRKATLRGRYRNVPVSGRLVVGGAGERGLGVKSEGVKLWQILVPDWLTVRLVGWLVKLPVEDGRLLIDVGKQAGIGLGPLSEVKATAAGLEVVIGE